MVQDGSTLNVDRVDRLLENVTIDPDFLTKVFLGGCPSAEVGCTSPEGRFADLNVWSRPLTKEELEEWTACK